MTKDELIIKRFCDEYKINLEKFDSYDENLMGYVVNAEGRVEALNLQYLYLKKLPAYLAELSELKTLDIRSNKLLSIEEIDNLTKLETLIIANNKIADISVVKRFKNLRVIDAFRCPIIDLTPIKNLDNIEKMEIECGSINDFTPITNLQNLEELTLFDYNQLKLTFLRECKKIKSLTIWGKQRKKKASMDIFDTIRHLELYYLSIDHFTLLETEKLKYFPLLKKLLLYSCDVKDIHFLYHLPELEMLGLDKNEIDFIQPVSALTKLKKLEISDNQIKDITPLKNLKQLKSINLRNNPITDIQPLLDLNLSFNDEKVAFWGNKILINGCNQITNPPLDIVRQGDEAIRRYFNKIKEEGRLDYIYEAKLILVGQGNAGKTSLQKRLFNEKAQLPKKDKHTRGIEVVDFKFDINKIAHIWDFGGQVVYYPVHRFFITENAVFVLLASTREHNHNFDYWIPTIYQFGGQSPIIIGQTCHEGLTTPWNDLGVYLSKPNFNIIKITAKAYHEIDLTNKNRGLHEIKKCIIERIEALPHFGKGVPPSWSTVRNALLEKAKTNPCISFESFENLCKKLEPVYLQKEKDIKDCCRFFHDIGVVLWYSEIEELKEWVVLDPKWAMNAVYTIIDDKEIQSNNGMIHKSDFERLWVRRSYKGKHEILKKMLVRFKIAFPARHAQNQTYILPAQLESMPVEKKWDLKEESLRLEYRFEFMPKGIVNQLSAELSGSIHDRNIWNNAVNFMRENNESQVIEDLYNRTLSITSKGLDARSNNAVIMNALDSIIREYKGVEAEIHVPCTCKRCRTMEKPTTFLYDDLTGLMNEGESKVRCNPGREDLNIYNLLYNAGFKTIQPEEALYRQIHIIPFKETIKIFLASSKELKEDRDEFEIFINRENKAYNKKGVFFDLVIWEDFIDCMSQTKLQEEYDKAAAFSDIFISLFWTKVGKHTKGEFSKAYAHFKEKDKPKIYTYFKDEPVNPRVDNSSLVAFTKELEELGHYPTIYKNIEDLKYKFKMQLQKLLDT